MLTLALPSRVVYRRIGSYDSPRTLNLFEIQAEIVDVVFESARVLSMSQKPADGGNRPLYTGPMIERAPRSEFQRVARACGGSYTSREFDARTRARRASSEPRLIKELTSHFAQQ